MADRNNRKGGSREGPYPNKMADRNNRKGGSRGGPNNKIPSLLDLVTRPPTSTVPVPVRAPGHSPSQNTTPVSAMAPGPSSSLAKTANPRHCYTCGFGIHGPLKIHFLKNHAPWFYDPLLCCLVCNERFDTKTQANQAHVDLPCERFNEQACNKWMSFMIQWLVDVQLQLHCKNLPILLIKVQNEGLFPEKFTEKLPLEQTLLWEMIDEYLELPIPPNGYSVSPPNSVAPLLHHSVMMRVLGQMSLKQRVDLLNLSPKFLTLPLMPIEYFDSHCHVFECLAKYKSSTLDELSEDSKQISKRDIRVPKMISNVVFGTSHRKLPEELDAGRLLPEVLFTIGNHPSSIVGGQKLPLPVCELERFVADPRIVGIGEFGYDVHHFSQDTPKSMVENCLVAQDGLFKEHLSLANKFHLPIVLHIRYLHDVSEVPDDLHQRAIDLASQMLDPMHKIHVHSFVGSEASVKNWVSAFPNTYFGLNAMNCDKVSSYMTLTHLILETDAPYLTSRIIAEKRNIPNSPYFIHCVAKSVAKTLNLYERMVVRQSNKNTISLYGRF